MRPRPDMATASPAQLELVCRRLLAICAVAVVFAGVSGTGSAAAHARSWRLVHVPSAAVSASWLDVSCWARGDCVTVGSIGAGGATLNEGGGHATLGRQRKLVASVSCPRGEWCMGTGWTLFRTFAQRWGGKNWGKASRISTSNLYGPRPLHVSCTSRSSCYAVGSETVSTLVDCPTNSPAPACDTSEPYLTHWNGRRWRRVKGLPLPAAITPRVPVASLGPWVTMNSVTCAARGRCVAVGSWASGPYTVKTKALLYADVLNGKRWRLMSIPTPRNATDAELISVSCSAPRRCLAVGDYGLGGARLHPLAASWNGRRWSLAQTRLPGHRAPAGLSSVSCVHHGPCVAVGGERNSYGNGGRPVAERWHGGHWTVERTAHLKGLRRRRGASLTSVSCTGARFCEATGDYGIRPKSVTAVYGSFIERYAS